MKVKYTHSVLEIDTNEPGSNCWMHIRRGSLYADPEQLEGIRDSIQGILNTIAVSSNQ